MTRHASPKLHEDISPNLVPMIDIMFLLLLFFMLGADMSQHEAVALPLPPADQARDEREIQVATTTVNVRHVDSLACDEHANGRTCDAGGHWVGSVRGVDHALEGADAGALRRLLESDASEFREPTGAGEPARSSKRVLVRADRSAPYGRVQSVIQAAASAGLYRVELAARAPDPAAAAGG